MEEKRNAAGQTLNEFLQSYDASKFERPSVTVDAVLIHNGKLLMIKRGNHPFIGQWALPGGFAEPSETTDEAVRRELTEETGIKDIAAKQLRVWSEPGRDPRTWIITVAYLVSFIDGEQTPKAAEDAADARWFDLSYGLKVESELDDTLYIKLSCDGEVMDYAVKRHSFHYPSEPEYILDGECDIASDHALIIADALYKILDKKL